MPYFENDVYLYFKKEIEESANERIEALKKEIEDTKNKHLKQMEDEIRETVNRVIDTELNEINVDFSATMNRIKTTTHQEIIKKKQELMDSIIQEVKDKCLAFVKTAQYEKSMRRLIKRVETEFCGDNFLFQIKKGDKVLETLITTEYKKNYKLEITDTIKIGGFIGICTEKGILTDQTIDNTLEEARVKFYENSKLAIKQ